MKDTAQQICQIKTRFVLKSRLENILLQQYERLFISMYWYDYPDSRYQSIWKISSTMRFHWLPRLLTIDKVIFSELCLVRQRQTLVYSFNVTDNIITNIMQQKQSQQQNNIKDTKNLYEKKDSIYRKEIQSTCKNKLA